MVAKPAPPPARSLAQASRRPSFLPAIPEFHQQPALLSFWTECCGPAGVYHSSADRLVQQLEASFAGAVNADYPGLADPGGHRGGAVCPRVPTPPPAATRRQASPSET